jgi:L-fuconolactonase
LTELAELCVAFPETPIVLNHLGTPLAVGRYLLNKSEAENEWKAGMATLAQLPNVFVKLGGMNMPFTGLGVDQDAATPAGSTELAERQRKHVLTTIDLFGPDRCMFESNFPVDGQFVSYTVLWNTFKRITSDFSKTERAQLFAGTAQRIYGIKVS